MQSAKEYKSFIEGALSTKLERAKQFWHIKSKQKWCLKAFIPIMNF